MKPIPSGPILHGLQAASQILAQPKGSVSRISNFCYKKRGAMSTIDGTEIINWYLGAIQSNRGDFETLALFQPLNIARYFMALIDAPDQQLSAPTGLAISDSGPGGSLPAGNYFYKVTAIDGIGGETTASNEVSIIGLPAGDQPSLTWTPVPNAAGYNVYRSSSTNTETILVGTGLPTTSASFIDNGSATLGLLAYSLLASPLGATRKYVAFSHFQYVYTFTTTGPNKIQVGQTIVGSGIVPADLNIVAVVNGVSGNTVICNLGQPFALPNEAGGGGNIQITPTPPLINTTSQLALVKMPNIGNYPIGYSNLNIVALFPASPTPIQGGEPAGTGGAGSTAGGGVVGGTAPTPLGGVVGNTGPLPQLVQFVNELFLALGNGFLPQVFSDPSTVTPLTNNFVPAFDAWLEATPYALNSLIVPANVQWSPNVAYGSQAAIVPDTPNGFYYVASKGGTSGSTQPAFPVIIGATVTDGSVTWTCAGSSLYYYQATQGGVSGGTANNFTVPAFPQTIGGTVTDGNVVWTNAGLVTSAAPVPPGAAHAIVYSGSLWVANTWPVDNANGIDGPCSLRMSNTNNPTSWNPINQAFLDKDDGTEIQGMATFTISAQGIPPEGSLVVFKDFSTYQVQGVFGASNFAIQRVVTDMGCVAPRSIQFVPGFGIVRLTHLGFAKFDGVRDEIISEEIRPYLYPSNDANLSDIVPMDQNYAYGAQGFQTANPPMYCCAIPIGNSVGALTRLCCFDLVTKEWTIVDLPFSISCAVQVRAEGTIPIAMFGGSVDGVLQRWQAGDVQWYTNAGAPAQQDVAWSFRTQEVASQVADQRLYFRRIAIRGYNTNSTASVKVIPTVNGIAGPTFVSAPLPLGDFEIFAPIAMTGVRAHADISGSADVEIQGWSFHTEPKPAGVPVVIS